MIPPAWFLAVLYLLTGVAVLSAIRWDVHWLKAARIFLALVMFSWAGFYMLVMVDPFNFEPLRSLSRWLHVPTAVAILLITGSRWYAFHKERPLRE